jgi:hypothetical protein
VLALLLLHHAVCVCASLTPLLLLFFRSRGDACSAADAAADAACPLPSRGGLHAPEAVELLRAFYLRGNPNGACSGCALRVVSVRMRRSLTTYVGTLVIPPAQRPSRTARCSWSWMSAHWASRARAAAAAPQEGQRARRGRDGMSAFSI